MIYAIETLPLAFLAASAPSQVPPTLCQNDENTVFYGQVEDEMGFDVAVCTSKERGGQRLAIRWEGEGGGSSISCNQGDCDGRIEYSRCTSPNLTILNLGWIEGCKKQIVTQSLSRADMEAEPTATATHTMYPAHLTWYQADIAGYVAFPVSSREDPLALMAVESVLSPKPGSLLLFGEAPQ